MFWPDGCLDPITGQTLVDIAFGHKDKWVYPHIPNTYLSLNRAVPLFRVYEPINRSEELWVIFRNADDTNVHTCSLAVTVEGVE
jgi:hypothetical protein